METVGIIVANALAIGLIILVGHALPPLPLWPERTARPWECRECGLTFSDARQVAWHGNQHLATLCGASTARAATASAPSGAMESST